MSLAHLNGHQRSISFTEKKKGHGMPWIPLHLALWCSLIFTAIWHFTEEWSWAAQDLAFAVSRSSTRAPDLFLGSVTWDTGIVLWKWTSREQWAPAQVEKCGGEDRGCVGMGDSTGKGGVGEACTSMSIFWYLEIPEGSDLLFLNTKGFLWKRVWHVKKHFLFWENSRFTCTCKK